MEDIKLRVVVHLTALTILVIPRLVAAAIVFSILYLYSGLGYTFLEVLVLCIITELATNGLIIKYKQVNNAINKVIEGYTTTE